MNDRRPLIVTGLVLLLILVLIGGVIFYLINFIRGRQTTEQATRDIFPRSSASVVIASPNVSAIPYSTLTPSPTASPNQIVQQPVTGVSGNSKTISASGFQISSPKDWGVLTCLNSQNFELDPYNSQDVSANCVKAIKSVTVLVGKNSCVGGQIVILGNITARKVVDNNFITRDGKGVQYHWCTQTTPNLDITHRVGTGTAFSADNFSATVEQMISTFAPVSGS